ncbi:hypothetical protein [Mycobacterium sp. CnD-18-1]|uniref:hypothetical protein n=1 Tax=Mycobacterium sp. CnD-18-1 TaxID=2917744 RepID=UPI001EF166A0|nr:hypothetical protein [Mycobacterium sp. CnD-18-1]MCG7607129.1 hypothetical protein [Mycobacterium sp. CnD-18-1]
MGLNTTHGCWDGAYGGFAYFRELVGKAAGLPHRDSRYGGQMLDIDWETVTHRQIMGHWDRKAPTVESTGIYDPPITDPVLYLLVHSDCEGKLRRGYLPALKARLEELEPAYDRLVARQQQGAYLGGRLRLFIDGLADAIEAGEHVEFH